MVRNVKEGVFVLERGEADVAVVVEGNVSGECVVRVPRVPDGCAPPELERVLEPLLRAGGLRRLVLDLSEVVCLDSATLALLIRARRALGEGGGRIALRGCQPGVRSLLERTRLVLLFDMLPER